MCACLPTHTGEERDAASFVPSIASVLESYQCFSPDMNAQAQTPTYSHPHTHTERTKNLVLHVLNILRNLPPPPPSDTHATFMSFIGGEGLPSLDTSSLLQWQGGGSGGGGQSVRLGVLLDEKMARAALQMQDTQAKKSLGNANSDLDRAHEADERKR